MVQRRPSLPRGLKKRLVEESGYRCWYCLLPFGTQLEHRGKLFVTDPVVDHVMPRAWTCTDSEKNLVASCQTCNSFKNDFVFSTIEEVRDWILSRWRHNQVQVVWTPSVSSEEDPETWSREFSRKLSDGF